MNRNNTESYISSLPKEKGSYSPSRVVSMQLGGCRFPASICSMGARGLEFSKIESWMRESRVPVAAKRETEKDLGDESWQKWTEGTTRKISFLQCIGASLRFTVRRGDEKRIT